MGQKLCRRCLSLEMSEAEYNAMIEKSTSVIKEEDKASQNLIDNRLVICDGCEKLNSGTCAECGCFVEIRAAIVRSKCPIKKW